MSSPIFISYRRGDDAGVAGRLYDRLEHTFGRQRLFMDVDNIPPGEDFVAVLEKQVATCDVLLALIGRGWLTATDNNGARRLDNPDDFVRIEIGSALAKGKRVIPVLIDDVTMPRANVLPDEMKALPRRQAVRIAHDRFRDDAERLARMLEKVLGEVEAQRQAEAAARRQAEEDTQHHAEAAKRQAEEEGKRSAERNKPKVGALLWILAAAVVVVFAGAVSAGLFPDWTTVFSVTADKKTPPSGDDAPAMDADRTTTSITSEPPSAPPATDAGPGKTAIVPDSNRPSMGTQRATKKAFTTAILFVIDYSLLSDDFFGIVKQAINHGCDKAQKNGNGENISVGFLVFGGVDKPKKFPSLKNGQWMSCQTFAQALAGGKHSITYDTRKHFIASMLYAMQSLDWAPFGGRFIVAISSAADSSFGTNFNKVQGVGVREINSEALRRGIATYVLHVLDENSSYSKTRDEFKILADWSNVGALYFPINMASLDRIVLSLFDEISSQVFVVNQSK